MTVTPDRSGALTSKTMPSLFPLPAKAPAGDQAHGEPILGVGWVRALGPERATAGGRIGGKHMGGVARAGA